MKEICPRCFSYTLSHPTLSNWRRCSCGFAYDQNKHQEAKEKLKFENLAKEVMKNHSSTLKKLKD
jgi:hypothetical protein